MRFTAHFLLLLLSNLALVLAIGTAPAPQAAGALKRELRQATRGDVVRRMIGLDGGLRRRQGLPSNGVYPLCAGSASPGTGVVFSVVADQIQATANVAGQVFSTESSALACVTRCRSRGTCIFATYFADEATDNCQNDESNAFPDAADLRGVTTGRKGATCESLGLASDKSCCNLWG